MTRTEAASRGRDLRHDCEFGAGAVVEMEHALLRRAEQLAEDFADLPLALVAQVVSRHARDAGGSTARRNADRHATQITDAARRELAAHTLA